MRLAPLEIIAVVTWSIITQCSPHPITADIITNNDTPTATRHQIKRGAASNEPFILDLETGIQEASAAGYGDLIYAVRLAGAVPVRTIYKLLHVNLLLVNQHFTHTLISTSTTHNRWTNWDKPKPIAASPAIHPPRRPFLLHEVEVGLEEAFVRYCEAGWGQWAFFAVELSKLEGDKEGPVWWQFFLVGHPGIDEVLVGARDGEVLPMPRLGDGEGEEEGDGGQGRGSPEGTSSGEASTDVGLNWMR